MIYLFNISAYIHCLNKAQVQPYNSKKTFLLKHRCTTLHKDVFRILPKSWNGSFCEKVEAVDQTCSVKKVFLEISQNSQENTYARVSF